MRTSHDEADVRRIIEQLASHISSTVAPNQNLNIVGIRTRGETLAQRLTTILQSRGYAKIGRGVLDITLYRDDLSEIGPRPLVRPTQIDIDIDGQPLLLVDDVLFTGRSIRAALDALSDFGRPSAIRLAVLVDRGGRELPIQPDFVGADAAAMCRQDHRVNVRLTETDGTRRDRRRAAKIDDWRAGTPRWTRKHLLGLEELSADEIRFVLDTADSFKEVSTRSVKKVPALRGRVVVNAFLEDSTRTRTSFALAAQRLSADIIDFSEKGSAASARARRSIDTARNIEAMGVDVIVIRHPAAGAAELLSRTVKCSIVNAGDGAHEHPTQGLLDLYTIRERFGEDRGAEGRDRRRHRQQPRRAVESVGPDEARRRGDPRRPADAGAARRSNSSARAWCTTSIRSSARSTSSTCSACSSSASRAASSPACASSPRFFGLTWDRFQRCKKDVFVMHPGPMNRGIEIQSDIADGPQSGILTQVTNGLAVRMAVLYLVTQAGAE